MITLHFRQLPPYQLYSISHSNTMQSKSPVFIRSSQCQNKCLYYKYNFCPGKLSNIGIIFHQKCYQHNLQQNTLGLPQQTFNQLAKQLTCIATDQFNVCSQLFIRKLGHLSPLGILAVLPAQCIIIIQCNTIQYNTIHYNNHVMDVTVFSFIGTPHTQ